MNKYSTVKQVVIVSMADMLNAAGVADLGDDANATPLAVERFNEWAEEIVADHGYIEQVVFNDKKGEYLLVCPSESDMEQLKMVVKEAGAGDKWVPYIQLTVESLMGDFSAYCELFD